MTSKKVQFWRSSVLCPDRDTLLNVSVRYLWVQGFSGSMVQTRSWWSSRDRGWEESMNCQSKTKTKLGSTTDTKVIPIVEGAQLIVNKCTQVCHYESYRMSWNLREQWCSAATTVTTSHRPGCEGWGCDKSTKEKMKREQRNNEISNSTAEQESCGW